VTEIELGQVYPLTVTKHSPGFAELVADRCAPSNYRCVEMFVAPFSIGRGKRDEHVIGDFCHHHWFATD